MNYSNYSNEELFNLTGTLPSERIEQIINDGKLSEVIEDCKIKANEASSGFVQEDFLFSQLQQLQNISKNIRGENRKELLSVITQIEDEILKQVRQGEYGKSELDFILSQ